MKGQLSPERGHIYKFTHLAITAVSSARLPPKKKVCKKKIKSKSPVSTYEPGDQGSIPGQGSCSF